jgi:hypothetical protein
LVRYLRTEEPGFLHFDPHFAVKELLRGNEDKADGFSYFQIRILKSLFCLLVKKSGQNLKVERNPSLLSQKSIQGNGISTAMRRIYEGLLSYRRGLPPTKTQPFLHSCGFGYESSLTEPISSRIQSGSGIQSYR